MPAQGHSKSARKSRRKFSAYCEVSAVQVNIRAHVILLTTGVQVIIEQFLRAECREQKHRKVVNVYKLSPSPSLQRRKN